MSDVIARCKRIMAAVDTYHERPDRMNRNTLRAMLVDEFEEFARAESRPTPEQSGEAQDAARYRYLRARPIGKSVPLVTDGIQFIFATRDESRNWVVHSRRGDEMDAAIDAAMDRSALGREG